MRKFIAITTVLLASVIAYGAVTAPDDGAPRRPGPTAPVGPADQATLQQDANMTQQMSSAGAGGPMQDYGVTDPQLQHSQNPAFVRQLEQFQGQIDRMLARNQ